MTEILGCGGGGWTLVMKMDGEKVKTTQALSSAVVLRIPLNF